MLTIFEYDFMVRAFQAGVIIALIAPAIGIFLVLRRYSLVVDTLAHVSFAGVAFALLVGIPPMVTALLASVGASLGIEGLRQTKRVYGESALALFLSGSLALAAILLSLGKGFSASLFSYLFGSIITVTQQDIFIIFLLGCVVAAVIIVLYRQLIYVSFDEVAAQVRGIRVQQINKILIALAAVAVSLSIPVVGVLLVAALMVLPVLTALQLRLSFLKTIFYAEAFSVFSVVAGIVVSFYGNVATGGTIVLIMLALFLLIFWVKKS